MKICFYSNKPRAHSQKIWKKDAWQKRESIWKFCQDFCETTLLRERGRITEPQVL